MALKKDNILGTYIPAFFEMQVDTSTNDFDLQKMSNKDACVFLHEYIHFLQDITTTYGLNNIYVYSEYVSSVVNRIYKSNTGTFDIPFIITDNNDNVFLNRRMKTITLGNNDIHGNTDNYFISNILTIGNILVYLLLKNGDKIFYYSFGALAIMENIAYIIERLCYPMYYVKSPNYPYTVAEQVSDYYVKGFSKNLEMVLALCEMSLMTSNPGYNYVTIMQNLQKHTINFKTPEDIYDYFYSQNICTYDNKTLSLIDRFKEILNASTEGMKEYVKLGEESEEYDSWINNIKDYVWRIRNNNEHFFLNIARGGDINNNQYFKDIVNTIGSPLLTSGTGHYFKIPYGKPEERTDAEYFRAIHQIIKLFEAGEVECSLYEWCKNSPKNHTNNYCNSSPWEKIKESKLCFYAMLWRNWNLTKYKPKFK